MRAARKSLAEIAIWYSIAIIASLFVVIFVMASVSEIPSISPALSFAAVLAVWFTVFGVSTWRLVRSERVATATTSLVPVHVLQAVLILFTIPHAILAKPSERDILSGMLLVWEVWGVVFTLSFLFLALLAKKQVGLRTWAASALATAFVSLSVYRRL